MKAVFAIVLAVLVFGVGTADVSDAYPFGPDRGDECLVCGAPCAECFYPLGSWYPHRCQVCGSRHGDSHMPEWLTSGCWPDPDPWPDPWRLAVTQGEDGKTCTEPRDPRGPMPSGNSRLELVHGPGLLLPSPIKPDPPIIPKVDPRYAKPAAFAVPPRLPDPEPIDPEQLDDVPPPMWKLVRQVAPPDKVGSPEPPPTIPPVPPTALASSRSVMLAMALIPKTMGCGGMNEKEKPKGGKCEPAPRPTPTPTPTPTPSNA